jgi:nitrite reductase (NADH) large subunit
MKKLIVIGNGMAGVACVEQILKYAHNFEITIFGEETHVNYNRILLSSVLAGEKTFDDIVLNGVEWYQTHGIRAKLGVRVTHVDIKEGIVIADDGSHTSFDNLIFATGSRPYIPPIDGVEKQNVHVFRTIDDTRALIEQSRPGRRAVVIGGGLLGLEAARGLQVRGCDVTVVHLAGHLMERQLDHTAGEYLRRTLENLGLRVMLNCQTTALLGDEKVEGLRFQDGREIEAELVVIAAGIKPNVELALNAGIQVRRGIVVNDFMETSAPGIYAVGECTEHRGQVFGLVAPLYEQGKVLAAAITGHDTRPFEGAVVPAKLKIAGVDVFSAGDIEDRDDFEVIRYEDAALGIYKKLVLNKDRLVGVVLVGDTSDDRRYLQWIRDKEDLRPQRRHLLFPPPVADYGHNIAAMPDSEIICGCTGVTKGTIISAIQQHGLCSLEQVKERTGAASGCGSCAALCTQLVHAVIPDYEEHKTVLCDCVPFAQETLREIIRSQRLRSVQQVLDIYGNGKGCEVCKPALSYLVDIVWCGEHAEDRSARHINDRVHANIQRDGTFSVVPRIRGGVTTPDELRRIADVADKYNIRMVKITGSQRIDLLGVKKEDLPKVWEDLGMPSGQAYTKGVRMVKTCVGSEFCRFGTQNSIAAGIELERRLENLYTPHKVKMAVVGCPRNCAEATVKDIGLIGQEGNWQVVVGGAAGKRVRKADLLITVTNTEDALEAAMLFFQYYRENANYMERTYDFVERVGIEKIRKETVYAAPDKRRALLERLKKSKQHSYDAWLERYNPRPTQFVQIYPLEMANT